MLEQSISIDKLIEVLKRIKERDGLETITSFELLHVLPSDEAAQQSVHPTGGNCAECGELQVVFDGCCINCGTPATSG